MTEQKKGINEVIINPLILMVGQGRIELPTLGFSVMPSGLFNSSKCYKYLIIKILLILYFVIIWQIFAKIVLNPHPNPHSKNTQSNIYKTK